MCTSRGHSVVPNCPMQTGKGMEMYCCRIGNIGIMFLLTLVVHVLLIVISPSNVLRMRINEQKSATMVTINLKVSMCKDIIANSNTTKAHVVNPCDSCNTDVNNLLNALHVHVYSAFIYFVCTCIVHTLYVYSSRVI